MTYVMSGIHDCCREYSEMLEKIACFNTDLLYIIGNVVDRGPDVIPLLEDIVARRNVCLLAGNHGMRCGAFSFVGTDAIRNCGAAICMA